MGLIDNNTAFLEIAQPCDQAIDWLVSRLKHASLQVLRTFDLQSARQTQFDCPCPHHGTEQCDCQMVVLQVYRRNQEQITIVAHGYNHQTWFSLVDTPQQRADPDLQSAILSALTSPVGQSVQIENQARSI